VSPTKWNRAAPDRGEWSLALRALIERLHAAALATGLEERHYLVKAARNAKGNMVVCIIIGDEAPGFGPKNTIGR
jgi:hypothetical protein